MDAIVVEILAIIDSAVQQEGLSYFLVGATARDIILTNVFGVEAARATRDVDLAVSVDGWSQFEKLKQRLLADGRFMAAEISSRLYFKLDNGSVGYPVDLIPFGGVEDASHAIAWPPDMATVMNLTGYAEARACVTEVEIASGLLISVVSLASLAVLKLIAWSDSGLANSKDAQDLYFLMRSYAQAGNQDRLYTDEHLLLETCGYDLELAGAGLLGKDVAALASANTLTTLRALLSDQNRIDRLTLHMAQSGTGLIGGEPMQQIYLSTFIGGLFPDLRNEAVAAP